MKIDLSIYQSILHSDLRPWLETNKDDNRFKAKLTPNFKNPAQSSTDFESAINKALIDYKGTLNEEDYLFELPNDQLQFNGVVAEILYPLIEINAEDTYFKEIRELWSQALRDAYRAMPNPTWADYQELLNPGP